MKWKNTGYMSNLRRTTLTNTLSNKIAFVTGATSGFGKSISIKLVESGARVIATGRRMNRLQDLSNKLGQKNLLPLCFDVRNQKDVFTKISNLENEWSKIDILVNNAGLALGLDSADEASIDDWDEMVDSNCKGLMYVTLAISKGMVERKNGHIINIGSVAGTYPYFGANIYGATKAFVHQFSLNLRADLVEKNIRVTSVEPGAAKTEFSLVRFHGDQKKANETYEGFKPINPENIAEIVDFIAKSPANININRIEIMASQQGFAGFNFIRE